MEDETLVVRARYGDMVAVGELLQRHQNAVYTAALRLVGSADAEDIAQETLVRAYTRLSELREHANFSSWIRRIAVNLSFNSLRRRGLLEFEPLDRAQATGESATLIELPDVHPSPEDQVIAEAMRHEIDRFVRELPIDQRIAVVLRDMYGLDVSEVAELQRCGISAAKMRISRGREQLRRRISENSASQRAADAKCGMAPLRLYIENE